MFVLRHGCAFAQKESRHGHAFGAYVLALDQRAEVLNFYVRPIQMHANHANPASLNQLLSFSFQQLSIFSSYSRFAFNSGQTLSESHTLTRQNQCGEKE